MNVIVPNLQSIKCVAMRGGTTRGFFFRPEDLPRNPAQRDELLVSLVAGRDSRQADGMGGLDMLLSKVATVCKSERPDVDVECTFGVITPGSGRVKYGSNCGNLVSAVALYAIDEGLCAPSQRTVRMFNPDSNTHIEATILDAAEFRRRGIRAESMGMANTGTPVDLAFMEPSSTIGRGLLPTGRSVDEFQLRSGKVIQASVVDAGTVYIFADAADFDLDYATAPLTPERQHQLLAAVEDLRGQAAVLCGLAESAETARKVTPAVPKISLVSPSRDYQTERGDQTIKADDVDIVARIVSSQNLHKAYAVTGAIATVAASVVPGSIVNRLDGVQANASPFTLRIGHVSGIIAPRITWRPSNDCPTIESAHLVRTARRLMTGECWLPVGVL